MSIRMELHHHNSSRCLNKNESLLPLDTACFSVVNNNQHRISLYSIIDDCYVCDGLKWLDLEPSSNTTLEISTRHPIHMYIVKNGYQWCHHTNYTFQQYGHYGWNLTGESCSNVYTIQEPPFNPYFPIFIACLIYFLLGLFLVTFNRIVKAAVFVFNRLRRNAESGSEDNFLRLREQIILPLEIMKKSTRIQALDAFRGIAVLLMIFVNNGGGKYVFFNHSPWNGVTLADFVLPWFAWAIGFTLFRSVRSQLRLSVPRRKIIFMSLRRTIVLIILGLMINSLNSFKGITLSELRLFGVLQLLAISYFFCSFLETIFNKAERSFAYGRLMIIEDILDGWVQWIIVILITGVRTLILYLLPVPDCPKGYMGPGGYHLRGKYANCTGGAVGYIDRFVLRSHVYNVTENEVYGTVLPHDPEGIMNTMSAILIVYFGVQAGKIVMYHRESFLRMLIWCAITGLAAGSLCDFSKETGTIPLNKHMMSLSFVLLTSSSAFLLYAVLHYFIDYKKYWSGAPFIYAGTNSIFLYIGHYLTKHAFPWYWIFSGVLTHSKELFMSLWTTTLWTLISYYLYTKDVIITV